MPTLFILAGPNGAGKTTFYNTAAQEGFFPASISFLNIDLITKQELGGYTEANFLQAEAIYRQRVRTLIDSGDDFMIESNLAKESEYEWIKKMQRHGYGIVLYYLCTDYPSEVHVTRVQERVAEGGHDVPESIVLHRYRMSLLYLKSNLGLFTKAHLIDNSDSAQEVAVVEEGRIIYKSEDAPEWANESLAFLERLQTRRR